MPNAIKALWQADKPGINGWLAIPNGFSAELYATGGWDSLTVDMQHGIQDYLSVVTCFQAVRASGAMPMVRVPWNEPGIIGKVLDAGAQGVICPMVNTPAEAEAFVRACRYPPLGARSNGPIRAALGQTYGAGGQYQDTANEEVLCIPMIETREAMEGMDAILDVPGIDAVYVGPSDLAFSYGLRPALDREEPEIIALLERLVAAAGRRGIHAGIHCGSASYAARAIGMGFRLVTINSDAQLIQVGARAAMKEMRTLLGS